MANPPYSKRLNEMYDELNSVGAKLSAIRGELEKPMTNVRLRRLTQVKNRLWERERTLDRQITWLLECEHFDRSDYVCNLCGAELYDNGAVTK